MEFFPDKSFKINIDTTNSFPTGAGCASSASGGACLAQCVKSVLLKILETHNKHMIDKALKLDLSVLARKLSGSASRSVYGGFVQWDTSGISTCFKDENYWSDISIILLIVSDKKKDFGSTDGMKISVETSDYLKYRVKEQVPERLKQIKNAIENKDYSELYKITMKESNSLHAVCRDTYPSLNYLNDTSQFIIKCVNVINNEYDDKKSEKNELKCGYTFDAGPNAWIITSNKYKSMIKDFFENLLQENEDTEELVNKLMNSDNFNLNKDLLIKLVQEQKINKYKIDKVVTFKSGRGCYCIS